MLLFSFVPFISYATSLCDHSVSCSFYPLSRVLFNFRSRYLFTIGLRKIFRVGCWFTHIHTLSSKSTTLWIPYHFLFTYEAFTLYGILFQGTSAQGCELVGIPHISLLFQERIQFALCGFQSSLLTTSQLISFPTATKIFQFTA